MNKRGVLDFKALFALGIGFAMFIMLISTFFAATDTTLSATSIQNTYLNDTLNNVLQQTSNVFQNINNAWVIGAVAVTLLVIVGIYAYFVRAL